MLRSLVSIPPRSMGLRARALLYRYSRTASEDRATVLVAIGAHGLGGPCYGGVAFGTQNAIYDRRLQWISYDIESIPQPRRGLMR